MKQIRDSLGIVFYERTIAVSEVKNVGDVCQVRRRAQFQMPEGITLETIDSQQSAFAVFLKKHGFKSQKAVVGISARQIISMPLKIPPIADARTRYETIKLHLERKLEADYADIVFDCWDSQHDTAGDVLALMTLKKTVVAVKTLLTGCKITPVQITATSFGPDLAATPGVACHIVHYPVSLEVLIFHDGNLRGLLNLSKKADPFDTHVAEDVARQIKRALWSIPNEGNPPNYTVWTTASDAASVTGPLRQTLGKLKQCDIKAPDGSADTGELCSMAAQLAAKAVSAKPAPINFLNGHDSAKKAMIPKQWQPRIAMGAAAILILLGLYCYDWYADSRDAALYRQQLNEMSNNVAIAETMIERFGQAKPWFNPKPLHLENLRELTLIFPPNSDIWLTSLVVDESLNQIISGRATHDDAILDLVDKLKENPSFENINHQYTRKMGKNSDLLTFSIKFTYRGEQ